jgi:hypothetical protein
MHLAGVPMTVVDAVVTDVLGLAATADVTLPLTNAHRLSQLPARNARASKTKAPGR